MSEAYREAGVDLQLGDDLSASLFEAAKQTWQNRAGKFGEPTIEGEDFFSGRSLSLAPLVDMPGARKLRMHLGDDGVGTKVAVAQRMGNNRTVAHDLLAMVIDDAAIRGFETCAVTTTLDVRKLKPEFQEAMSQIALGYIDAAQKAKTAVVNGEVAELGALVGGYSEPLGVWDRFKAAWKLLRTGEFEPDSKHFNYLWNATVSAVAHEDRLVTGRNVRPGDALVGFREHGFRSNGLSLVRRLAQQEYGRRWHERPVLGVEGRMEKLGDLVLKPSIIYSPILVDAIGGYDLRNKGKAQVGVAAHVTGGGLPGKLGRVLVPSGLGADINDPFDPAPAMNHLARFGDISDEEIYKVWNMGQGMVVGTEQPIALMQLAKEYGVEAKVIGQVTAEPGITIRSTGNTPGKKLTYQSHSA